MNRREFLEVGAALAASGLFPAGRAIAGPFTQEDWSSYIPADKKLRPEWVASLFARGEPTVYSRSRGELKYIGMPVGGLCCGTLYLGGDGRLWLWDIFNDGRNGVLPREVEWAEVGLSFAKLGKIRPQDGAAYVKPHLQTSPVAQGFAVRARPAAGGEAWTRPLEESAWDEITFRGQYPVATIEYTSRGAPVSVVLEAYSPFVPLHVDDSSLPATILEHTIRNVSSQPLEVEIVGWLENAVSRASAPPGSGLRRNRAIPTPGATVLEASFEPTPPPAKDASRPDIVVEDFEREGYEGWTVEGDAFGTGPATRETIPAYQGDVGGEGRGVANSHATAPGSDIASKDARTGRLVSREIKLERRFLAFHIGGGANAADVGVHLLVEGKSVRNATGHNANRMRRDAFDLRGLEGKTARVEIYDRGTGGWGNIGVDHVVLTDTPPSGVPLEKKNDFGTMSLALLASGEGTDQARASVALPATAESALAAPGKPLAECPPEERLVGALARKIHLAPGASHTAVFAVTWHFPNTTLDVPDARQGNHYAARFHGARDVAAHLAEHVRRLGAVTRLWRDTWYNSTLPFWFLDRTFSNTSTLATSTSHRFASGRFWAWEGVGCCQGTCTHVWHYAQAMGRIFPELERHQREHVDFGVGFHPESGIVGHRGEGTGPAIDGQAGRILGVLREHQMSADDRFLQRVWPRVKKAVEHLLAHDTDGDGIIDGAQENTLDAAWFGQIAWISSLAVAALTAAAKLARELGETAFAEVCLARAAKGRESLETRLHNGEYFIQLPEKGHEANLGTYQGCHIDQVHGQSWAWQVGLGRILDRTKTLSALRALYKYNFAPDVGPFRARNREGRPYALPGDAGLVMATNPRLLDKPFGDAAAWQYGYFNECMSGFEHQAASHMIAEGLLLEGLAVTRAIHDRYHAARRNPYNEVECSDHYARAMASYGSFIAISGFTYHGPAGEIGFAPRLTPERFRSAFTAAEGWGTYEQGITDGRLTARLEVRHGKLRVNTWTFEGPVSPGARVTVTGPGGAERKVQSTQVKASGGTGDATRVVLETAVELDAGAMLTLA